MILDILVFTLGFLVAGLLALAALPAVWGRALRLTEERLSRLVPLSPEEIAADRDHLRAAHAVELRRTEQRLERAEADRAALRIEAARREQRILALDDEGARAQVAVAALVAELAGLRREVNRLWAEHGAEAIALHGLTGLAEARLRDIAALQAERSALRAERDRLANDVDLSRSRMAGLETRLVGSDTRGEDLQRELEQARREATAAAGRLAAAHMPAGGGAALNGSGKDLGALLEARTHEVESLTLELAFMSEQAGSAERRAAEAIKACEALRAGCDGTGGPPLLLNDDDGGPPPGSAAALAEDVSHTGQTSDIGRGARSARAD